MYSTSLPVIPFVAKPMKKWTKAMAQERLERQRRKADNSPHSNNSDMHRDDKDSNDEPEPETDVEESKNTKVQFRDVHRTISQRNDSANNEEGPSLTLLEVVIFPVVWFIKWRRRERMRRMHYIVQDYMKQVAEYDELIKRQVKEEMEEHELDILREAYESDRQRKHNSKKIHGKYEISSFLYDKLALYDKYKERSDFNCDVLAAWADEGYEIKSRRQSQQMTDEAADRERKRAAMKAENMKMILNNEKQAFRDDINDTQDLLRMMRRYGVSEGINTSEHSHEVTRLSGRNELEISLKSGVHPHSVNPLSIDLKKYRASEVSPFTHDLLDHPTVKKLKANAIGEKGALVLAAAFAKGVGHELRELNLSHCCIGTRGLGRVIRGFKVANIFGLRVLNLRCNNLTPHAVEYIKHGFDNDLFVNLWVLDLQENELGDGCCTVFVRLIINSCLKNLRELYLQNNGISDVGFNQLGKLLRSLQHSHCASLDKIVMLDNRISVGAKRALSPLPYCVVV